MSLAIVATVATVGSAAYGAYSAHQASSAAQKAQDTQVSAQDARQQSILDLAKQLDTKPKAAEYQPVDFTQAQRGAILGNRSNLDAIQGLLGDSNSMTALLDRQRANRLIPGFNQILKSEAGATGSLLNGQLPYDDVLGVVSDRNSLAGSLGTPGAAGNATLKDLGLSRLDAIKTGGGLFKDMVGIAQSVSPIERYGKPTDFFVSPEQRIQDTMNQNQLIQQSTQSKYNLDAAPTTGQQIQLAALLGSSGPLTPQPIAQPDYGKYALQAIMGLQQGYNSGALGGHYGATNVGTGATYGLPNATSPVYRPVSIAA